MAEKFDSQVLYEDNHLLVVNKTAPLATMGALEGEPTLLEHAKELQSIWKNDYWLGRAIAGLYPRLHAAPGHAAREYVQLLRFSNNPACERVLDYHFALMNDIAFDH